MTHFKTQKCFIITDIDKKIETEIVKMIAHIKTISNKPVDIQHVIWSTQANILLQVSLYTYYKNLNKNP